jgi:hypothetical protein
VPVPEIVYVDAPPTGAVQLIVNPVCEYALATRLVGTSGMVVYGPVVAAGDDTPENTATRLKLPDVGYNVFPVRPVRLYDVAGAVIEIGEPGTPVPDNVYVDTALAGATHVKLMLVEPTVPVKDVGEAGDVYPLVDVEPPLPDSFLLVIVNVYDVDAALKPVIVVEVTTPTETNFETPSKYVIS